MNARKATAAVAMAVLAAGCASEIPAVAPVTTTTVPAGYPTTPVGDDQIRLNQVQLVGAHNSYHVAPDPNLLQLMVQAAQSFPSLASGLGNPAELAYTHAGITQQLERGLRTFELDVFADPTGGRFANPVIPGWFGFNDPFLSPELGAPGFKVLHIQDIDYRSQCPSLVSCLTEIRTWSDANPGHLPIVINLELKDDPLPAALNPTPVLEFDGPMLDAVDAELEATIGDRIIRPDDVRGAAVDLRTAITTTGWPTLAASRGKVLFFIDNAELRDPYLDGHPSLTGRTMFTSSG
ncbi:MAG TPA: Ca2+-dependent phosphoinositide-specific phospholipase C, partial [Microthrixaceae bacterium]|nr:Ca2+-dependent phosphoinositide-specific phospholipase C [Microthrixaceae bacterium]